MCGEGIMTVERSSELMSSLGEVQQLAAVRRAPLSPLKVMYLLGKMPQQDVGTGRQSPINPPPLRNEGYLCHRTFAHT